MVGELNPRSPTPLLLCSTDCSLEYIESRLTEKKAGFSTLDPLELKYFKKKIISLSTDLTL